MQAKCIVLLTVLFVVTRMYALIDHIEHRQGVSSYPQWNSIYWSFSD